MSHFTDTLTDIRDRNAFHLSGDAELTSGPDTLESAGAHFLIHTRDALVDAVEYHLADNTDALDRVVELTRDNVHELADNAPDVYTGTRWAEFADLAAYQEDISEYGDYGSDLTQAAGVALYIIAERLLGALLDELDEAATTDDDEDESEA